jgi:hypothetical protein
MLHAYTARELARAAGFSLRAVKTGGAVVREYPFGRVLELGPAATELEIARIAHRSLIMPASARVAASALAGTSFAAPL